MVNVTDSAEAIVDIWEYAVPFIEANFPDSAHWDWRIEVIYEHPEGTFQHIYIPVPSDATYLIIVVDTRERVIIGHCTINFRKLYPHGIP